MGWRGGGDLFRERVGGGIEMYVSVMCGFLLE